MVPVSACVRRVEPNRCRNRERARLIKIEGQILAGQDGD